MVDWDKIEAGKSREYDRKKFENAKAMREYKETQFNGKQTVDDEYTGDKIHKKKQSAERKYRSKANKHLANTDHVKPLKEGFEETKYNYFVSDEQTKNALNKESNFALTNGNLNQSKKEKTNSVFVSNSADLSDETKARMLQKEREANKAFKKDIGKATLQGVGDVAVEGAVQRGKYGALYASLDNVAGVLQGEKDFRIIYLRIRRKEQI